jgi:hypothetical protein
MISFGPRRKKMKNDERIQLSLRQIGSQGFVIWYFLMLFSLLYRQFYLQQSIEQYWDFAAIFFIGAIYVSTSIFAQSAVRESAITRTFKFMAPTIIIVVVAVNYALGNVRSVTELISVILSASIGLSLVMAIFYILYKRWGRKTPRNG